jgi:hypothetical protein
MRDCVKDSFAIFVKKKMTKLPTTIDELRDHLKNLPISRIVDRLMNWTKFCA